MKLYNTYYFCKRLIKVFQGERIISNNKQNQVRHYIKEWNSYKETLETLYKVPIFKDLVESIYKTVPVFVRDDESPEINDSAKKEFIKINNDIVKRMSTVIELYESMNLPQAQNGINVKIPECQDLSEYIKYLNDINFIFTQCPYLLHKDETIKFASIDVGSIWLNFIIELSVGSTAIFYILNNLALIMDKVMVLKSHYNSIKEQKENLKIAQNKSKLSESEVEIFSILKKHYMNEVVTSLEEEISVLEDGDQRGRLEKSLEKLCNLLDKGVEIYAALDTPENVQVLFPALNEKEKLNENILRCLEDKEEK